MPLEETSLLAAAVEVVDSALWAQAMPAVDGSTHLVAGAEPPRAVGRCCSAAACESSVASARWLEIVPQPTVASRSIIKRSGILNMEAAEPSDAAASCRDCDVGSTEGPKHSSFSKLMRICA